MDIVRKRGIKGSQGNEVSEYSDIIARAGSWQYGNDAQYLAIEAEKKEEDEAFGGMNDFNGREDEEHDPDGIMGGK
jgi:hypothetical protein